ncbi:MAG TPA: methyltransferase domain-containing protein [Candidatus Sulfotelmatobacter sp.]|nr:methyltransferase domain-containing protein [Candidatus Sulfotelmatobacter sp.]
MKQPDTADTNVRDTAFLGSAGRSRPLAFSSSPEAHYDRVTDAWKYFMGSDLHVGYFDGLHDNLQKATQALTALMVESAHVGPKSAVLDVGCGTGNPAIHLARAAGCRVTGISTSQVCVDRANANAAEHGLEGRVSFSVADGTCTGFSERSFDCVWVMESSHLMPNKLQLLQECARVLREGGTLVLCDLALRRPMPAQPPVQLLYDLVVLEQVFGKASLQTIEEYINQCTSVGIDATGRDISEQVAPTFRSWGRNARECAAMATDLIGEKQVDLFIRGCEIMSRLFREGQLGYCLLAGVKLE